MHTINPLSHLKVTAFGLALLFSFLNSCCPDENCNGHGPEVLAWLPYDSTDLITYQNDQGTEVSFEFGNRSITEDYVEDDQFTGIGCGDGCSIDPESRIAFFTRDSLFGLPDQGRFYTGYSIDIFNRVYRADIRLTSRFLDHVFSFQIEPVFQLNPGDSLIEKITFGNSTYKDVIYNKRDTTLPNTSFQGQFFVIEIFYTKENGVIAFFDAQSETTFYLQN